MDPPSTESRHTAVIWIDPALPAPFELLTALAGRGIHSVRVSSPYMGLAEICRVYRARLREKPDKPLANVLALVVVNPDGEPRTPAVCEALERYAGGTPCWMYGPADAPELRPISESDLASWRPAAPGPLPTAAGATPEPPATPRVTEKAGRDGIAKPEPMKVTRQPRAPAAPQLRLAGSEASLPSSPPPRATPPAPKGHDSESEVSGGGGGGGGVESSRSVLTPEELSMLLGDEDEAG